MPRVKSRQFDNIAKKTPTTSTYATAKFLNGMKLILSAEFFLESLHSNIDKNSVNERMEFSRAYVPLLRSLGIRNMKQ